MAKNHFAYIRMYRKGIDELEQSKKELWSIMLDLDCIPLEKVGIAKEQESLSKTYMSLLRDLPFVSNLT